MIIDAHLHLWDLAAAEYPWLTPAIGPLYRSIGIAEIAPVLDDLGVDGVILVQASDEPGDTTFLRQVMAADARVVGVVAWSPLDQPERLARDLEGFAAGAGVVGIRNLIHEQPPAWLDRAEVERGLGVLATAGLPWDVPTADHEGLLPLSGIGARHPELRIVIDHLGKPPVGGSPEERSRWRRLLAECARNPLTVAKVSGLYAATGAMDSWTTASIRPFVEDALELFGPDRLIYGGDWPISELAGGYRRTWDALRTVLGGLGERDTDAIFGGTAARVYGLAPRG